MFGMPLLRPIVRTHRRDIEPLCGSNDRRNGLAVVGRFFPRRFLGLIVLLFLTGVPQAWSVTVEGLYEVRVPVADGTREARQEAYRTGLRQVLLRVAGRRSALASEGVSAMIGDRAPDLVQSYQYETDEEGQQRLVLKFGAVGVNRALADQGVAVWGANRPLTFAWIAVDSGRDRRLVSRVGGDSPSTAWRDAMISAATGRGLPLRLPSAQWHHDDALLSDIRGQFLSKLRERVADVPHNLLGIVNISRAGSGWEASWRLENGGEFGRDTVSADTAEQLASRMIGLWAESLAERYAVAAGDVSEGQKVDLRLDNVSDLDDYGAVSQSLSDMEPVDQVRPVSVTADRATFRATFSGELSVLKEYIALDKRYVVVEAASDPSSSRSEPESPASLGAGVLQPESSASGEGDQVADMLQYEPLKVTEAEGEADGESFESLYPVLRYRWRPVGTASDDTGPGQE
ncbi:hypothetical protein CF392_12790 [Tamilnaduibacter salinus]|uniref:DUF2066 domain-containing protein n=1 Tax=Tamilnaduibacter salinus TaxID=1484056 RepID=A0A2A2I1C7_9GAMM|nr:hypothetical protein CF392_12790 [Tamilnaduibacter salinus]